MTNSCLFTYLDKNEFSKLHQRSMMIFISHHKIKTAKAFQQNKKKKRPFKK